MRETRPLVGEAQRRLSMTLLDDEQLASGVHRLMQIVCALGDVHAPAALIALDAIEIAQRILAERRGDRAQPAPSGHRGRPFHRLVAVFGTMERLRTSATIGARDVSARDWGALADPAGLLRKAAEVRAAAAACRDMFARHEMLHIANRYERLARRLENSATPPPAPAVQGPAVQGPAVPSRGNAA
jgi:hypothetical protein